MMYMMCAFIQLYIQGRVVTPKNTVFLGPFWSTPCTSSVSFPCWQFGELLLETAALVQRVMWPRLQTYQHSPFPGLQINCLTTTT
ncbi:hypothetical protein GDO81_027598 [Engystomops pustulosus]|uniref:Secreted protein n=1 Tax=Engystomops pustulosus TaxID=76066 RepID=A0AAV6ZJU3_ENGPU|nr:hypothetical protein GDO81_027598 [Engystomops pustulosus]